MDPEQIRETLKKHRAEHSDAVKYADAWAKRARALFKVMTGYDELLDTIGPGTQALPLPGVDAPAPPDAGRSEETEAGNLSLNDAVERSLMIAGPRGASLGAIWEICKQFGAKTTMADTDRAVQFAIANLRKKGVKITRMPTGAYILIGRLAKDLPPELAAAAGAGTGTE